MVRPTRWRVALAAAMTAALMVSGCGNGAPGPDETKTVSATFGKVGPTADFSWNAGTGELRIVVTPPARMKAGWCVDGIFDWKFDNPTSRADHHDPRLVRACKTGAQIQYLFKDPAGGLKGLNKAAVCYGPDNKTNVPPGSCRVAEGSTSGAAKAIATVKLDLSVPDPAKPNPPCIGYYLIAADGQVSSGKGGDPESCTD